MSPRPQRRGPIEAGRTSSGIRAPRPQPPLFNSGFYDAATEVQIDERGKDVQAGRTPQVLYGSSLHKTGSIYEIAPATRWASRVPRPRFGGCDGGWNLFEITARGPSLEVRLNNHLVSRTDQLPLAKLSRGFIGLQCHTDLAQFRNIRVKAPGRSPANPTARHRQAPAKLPRTINHRYRGASYGRETHEHLAC